MTLSPNGNLYVLNLKEKKMPFFLLPNAEPFSEHCSCLRGKPICKLHSLCLSCKTAVKPGVPDSSLLIFKGSVSRSVWEAVCTLPLVCRQEGIEISA